MGDSHNPAGLGELVYLMRRFPLRWLLPAAGLTCLAVAYAALKRDKWEASQALMLRSEATRDAESHGRVRRPEDLKTSEETIMELFRQRDVLRATLELVGSPADYRGDSWPAAEDLAELEDAIRVAPPKGAEFGATEVFYAKVQHPSRSRSLKLTAALVEQVIDRYQELRQAVAKSQLSELQGAVEHARTDLEQATDRQSEIERQVGGDLAELRVLSEGLASNSDLRQKAVTLGSEIRTAEAHTRGLADLVALLTAAQNDSGKLLATPNRLLESQPSLRTLKQNLIDSQTKLATLRSIHTDQHPLVQTALKAEAEVSRSIDRELTLALRGLEVDLKLGESHIAALRGQLADVDARLIVLAGLRSKYATTVADVKHQTKLLEEAQRDAAAARNRHSGSEKASVLIALDVPQTGPRPVGPGRLMIGLVGVGAGLIVGLGLLLLTAPSAVRELAPVAIAQTNLPPEEVIFRRLKRPTMPTQTHAVSFAADVPRPERAAATERE